MSSRATLGWVLLACGVACAGAEPRRAELPAAAESSKGTAPPPPATSASAARASPTSGVDPRDVPPPEPKEEPGLTVAPPPPELGVSMQRFGFDLYRQLVASSEGGIVFSPLSVGMALTMLYGAAGGQTAEELRKALHLPEDRELPHRWYQSWLAWSRLDRQGEKEGLRLANRMWGFSTSPPSPEYAALLQERYASGTSAFDVPFNSSAEKKRIQRWIAWMTRDRIPELPFELPQGIAGVLANALYLELAWGSPFDPKRTKPGPFRVRFGEAEERSFMHGGAKAAYAKRAGITHALLPYQLPGRSRWALLLAVPDGAKQLAAAEESVIANAGRTIETLKPVVLSLGLPRVQLAFAQNIVGSLKALGIRAAFEDEADLARWIPGIAVDQVVHGATVEIDEKGTVATAATVIVVKSISDSGLPIVALTVDRPFAFSLIDTATGVIVVAGRYVG